MFEVAVATTPKESVCSYLLNYISDSSSPHLSATHVYDLTIVAPLFAVMGF